MSFLDAARRSLRSRLSVGLTAGVVIVMTTSGFALHGVIRGQLYQHLDEDLLLRLRAVAEYAATHPGQESVAELMPQFRTRAHEDFFQVWDASGHTLARSDSSIGKDLPRPDVVDGEPVFRDLVLPDRHHGRAVSQRFELPQGDPRGALHVVTAEETENLEALESRIHLMLLLVTMTALIAMLVIARYSVDRGLRPMREFVQSLEQVSLDDPRATLDTGPMPAELRPVAATFSQLLDRLLQALAQERRYARNLAHELRNPLAEIRLLTDVGQGSGSTAECHASMREIGSAAAEMERIVDTLMAMTRYEAGLEQPQPEPFDLSAELRRLTEVLRPLAGQRGLRVQLDLPGEAWVHADSALVARLLGNLLGNAVAHAPEGAAVAIGVAANGDVTVSNPAPHLTREDLAKLGEQFFHVDSAGAGSHAGLGLPLAKAIAKMLGLELSFALQDDGCLIVSVRGFRSLGESLCRVDGVT